MLCRVGVDHRYDFPKDYARQIKTFVWRRDALKYCRLKIGFLHNEALKEAIHGNESGNTVSK